MKKLISLALCLTLALAFTAGCKKKEEAPAPAPAPRRSCTRAEADVFRTGCSGWRSRHCTG